MREAGHPFTERDLRQVQRRISRGASAIAQSMVAGAAPAGSGWEPGSVWLDESGAIIFASPAAQRWLNLLDERSRPGFARALLAGLTMRAGRGVGPDAGGGSRCGSERQADGGSGPAPNRSRSRGGAHTGSRS